MRSNFLLSKCLVLSIVVASTLCMTGCGLSGCGKKKNNADVSASVEVSVSGTDLGTADNAVKVSDGNGGTGSVTVADKTDKTDKGSDKTGSGTGSNVTVTAKPETTANPGATAKPAVTSAPTEKPSATQKPSGNTGGGASSGATTATATPKPAVTAKPTATTAPTATTKPVATATPKPAVTAKPTATTAPTATTKPVATAKPTQTPGIAAHTCVWSSGSVTKAATCQSEGTMSYTCTICNDIKTESIAKTDHKYKSVSVSASCTEPGTVVVSCETCGHVNSSDSSGSALGHDYYKSWNWGPPSCSGGSGYTLVCSRCGASGGEGFEPALEHTMVGTTTFDGDCSTPTIVEYKCSVCGAPGGTDYYYPDEHDFVEKLTDPYWSEEKQDFVQDTVTRCSRCNASP